MSNVTMGPHPEFDALSAFADQDAARASRTHVGRHVAGCDSCRTVVDEIRAMGQAARALDVELAGSALWERIRVAADSAEDSGLDAPSAERAVAIERQRDGVSRVEDVPRTPTPSRTSLGARVLGGATVVLALAAAIALWPSRSSLNASGTSRLTFTPGRPVPGGMMTVRYQPASWFKGAPRLVLAGRFVQPTTAPYVRYVFVDARDGLDSLATLRPTPDGTYEARVRLPEDFLGVRMAVFDSTGEVSDRDGGDLWVAIGGQRDHSPSLAALVASYTPANGSAQSRRRESRQSVSVADSIQRYFPGHPAGWSLYDRFGTTKGVLDFFRYFSSAEKKYASLDETLYPKKRLDAEQMWAMVSLASRITEPAEEAKWTMRLVREHPEDPRAFRALVGVVHGIELRDPPHVADSIRPWLPVLDSLYERSHPVIDAYSNDILLFSRQGDSAQKTGWSRRITRQRAYFTRFGLPKQPDAALESSLRRQLAAGCAKPAGKFPLPDVSAFTQWCTFDHMYLWVYLSEAHLARGEAVVAEALADSAVAVVAGVCGGDRTALITRADARLARADTAGAARDYLSSYGRWIERKEARERAAAVLGPRFDAARFDAAADSIRKTYVACHRERQVADSTRRARYAQP